MNQSLPTGAVIFDHVTKRYRLGTLSSLRSTIDNLFHRSGDNGPRTLWALRDVSFRVEPGASLGLIGPNGAGKTTTLKLLSNITRPASGRVLTHGRISSLIELGAGFHPELTGRENIYLNGAILGLKRHEITRKFDAIISFAELEPFLDTPVKRYSSGMYVRLGFAVAAHVEPDVLLVDEVLAVGDTSFRHRCVQRMRDLQHNGATVVFVSHNMHQVRNTCDTALLLMHGQIKAQGTPDEVITEYECILLDASAARDSVTPQSESIHAQTGLILKAVEISGPGGEYSQVLRSDECATLKIVYQTARPQLIGRIDIRVLRDDGTLCSAIDAGNAASAAQPLNELAGAGVIEVTYDPLQLTTGQYTILVQITDPSDVMVIAAGQTPRFVAHAKRSVLDPGIYMPRTHWVHHSTVNEGRGK